MRSPKPMYHVHIAPPKIVVYTQPGKNSLSKGEDNPPPKKKQLQATCNHGLPRHRLHSRGTAPRIGHPCGVCPSPGQHAEHPPGEETKSTPPRSVFRPAAQAVRVLTLCECES